MDAVLSPLRRGVGVDEPIEAPPTTDFTIFESQKENIRPLATGRSAATLKNLFEKSSAADKLLQEEHERFQIRAQEAQRRDREGEDMPEGAVDLLDVYNQHIIWMTQHNTSSGNSLLPLLENVTRLFVDDTRYSQDVRYLKLWVMQTRLCERREEIWSFLESRSIGTNHAVFYEEWAAALEGLGRKKKADQIYQIGIARKASPLERLKTRHAAFLQRQLVSTSSEIPEDDPITNPARTPARSVLGQTSVTPSIAGATQLAPSTRLSRAPNSAKMNVFSDQSGKGPGEESAPSEWADLGTRDGRRKENVVEATPWKGETLPQKAALAPRTPKVEVFKDTTASREAVRPVEDNLFKQKHQTEAEILKSNPLLHYENAVGSVPAPASIAAASMPPPPSVRKAPRPKATEYVVPQPWVCPSEGRDVMLGGKVKERRGFDWDAVFKNGEEWSFEEVRARSRGLIGKEWRGDVKEWEREWHSPGASTPKKAEEKRKPPSPTFNTKLANEDVMAMFDQTIHGGKVPLSDSESDSSDEDEDEGAHEEVIQTAPTPIPRREPVMMTATGMVPPTPTPAQGTINKNRSTPPLIFTDENATAKPVARASPPAIFSDENAIPASATKVAKMNVFSDTPASTKTPLVARTPLGSNVFGILSQAAATPVAAPVPEIPEEPEVEDDLPASANILPPRNNIFSTPALSRPARRNVFAAAALEEQEDAEENDAPLNHIVEDNEDEADNVQEPYQHRRIGLFEDLRHMTPITERTMEYTQMTNLRSSQSGTTGKFTVSSGRRSSVAGTFVPEEEEEEEERELAQPPTDNAMPSSIAALDSAPRALSAVLEEDERSSGARSATPDTIGAYPLDESASPRDFDHSGSISATGFGIPDGFTIQRQLVSDMHTMTVVDGHVVMSGADQDGSVAGTLVDTPQTLTTSGFPNPCCPLDDEVLATLLPTLLPALSTSSHFHDLRHTTSNRLPALQKHAKAKTRRSSTAPRQSSVNEDAMVISLDGWEFEIYDKIGEGGFGAVFSAVDMKLRREQEDASDDEEDDDDEDVDQSMVAIKVEGPASVWEAVILDRIRTRLDASLIASIIRPRDVFAFADESFLLLDFSPQGTLLDVVNKASTMGIAPATAGTTSSLDEMVAIFFTIELLRTLESLHRGDFIHGDLKIDNCLVRLETTSNAAWSAQYDSKGHSGWSSKGIKLIDFGRAIDTSLFPAGQRFMADWEADEKDCIEVRQGQSWTFENDYYGLAGICYCMLFGKFMVTAQDEGECKIADTFRRYWQQPLWTRLFHTLLNPGKVAAGSQLPINDELALIREDFEAWLQDNCQKGGKSLKSMLKKIELAAITGGRR